MSKELDKLKNVNEDMKNEISSVFNKCKEMALNTKSLIEEKSKLESE